MKFASKGLLKDLIDMKIPYILGLENVILACFSCCAPELITNGNIINFDVHSNTFSKFLKDWNWQC